MYACINETHGGFFEVVCAPNNATANFRDPPLPLWLSRRTLCQHTVPNDARRSESLLIASLSCTGNLAFAAIWSAPINLSCTARYHPILSLLLQYILRLQVRAPANL